MNDSPPPTPPDDPDSRKGRPKLALAGLVLAFVPSVILLALLPIDFINGNHGTMLWLACGASIVCCLMGSILLFRHNKIWAICLALVFLLLNTLISVALGCGAFVLA